MDETQVAEYITATFDGVHTVDAWGDTFFYYNPDQERPDEFYFATLKTKDDDYDRVSNLDRPGIFRLNIGVGRATYRSLVGAPPRSGESAPEHDFTALDRLLPHPVYGQAFWVCVLNPSDATFQTVVRPLLAEAYDRAVSKYTKAAARGRGAAAR
jgi:hypothetical protein